MITSYAELLHSNSPARRAELCQTVWEKSGGVCGLCGGLVDVAAMHIDHIVPRSRGGSHDVANLQAAHPACNIRKSNRDGLDPKYPRIEAAPKPKTVDDEITLDTRVAKNWPMRVGDAAAWLGVSTAEVKQAIGDGRLRTTRSTPRSPRRVWGADLQRFRDGLPPLPPAGYTPPPPISAERLADIRKRYAMSFWDDDPADDVQALLGEIERLNSELQRFLSGAPGGERA